MIINKPKRLKQYVCMFLALFFLCSHVEATEIDTTCYYAIYNRGEKAYLRYYSTDTKNFLLAEKIGDTKNLTYDYVFRFEREGGKYRLIVQSQFHFCYRSLEKNAICFSNDEKRRDRSFFTFSSVDNGYRIIYKDNEFWQVLQEKQDKQGNIIQESKVVIATGNENNLIFDLFKVKMEDTRASVINREAFVFIQNQAERERRAYADERVREAQEAHEAQIQILRNEINTLSDLVSTQEKLIRETEMTYSKEMEELKQADKKCWELKEGTLLQKIKELEANELLLRRELEEAKQANLMLVELHPEERQSPLNIDQPLVHKEKIPLILENPEQFEQIKVLYKGQGLSFDVRNQVYDLVHFDDISKYVVIGKKINKSTEENDKCLYVNIILGENNQVMLHYYWCGCENTIPYLKGHSFWKHILNDLQSKILVVGAKMNGIEYMRTTQSANSLVIQF